MHMKTLKFGVEGRECPHCVGLQALAGGKFTRDEIEAAYEVGAHLNIHRQTSRTAMRDLTKKKLKGKKNEADIQEALGHQARIEQLNHGGWPIEIQAWAVICPDCDTVTQFRAVPSASFIFTKHGPVAEMESCSDCIEVKNKAAFEQETLRLSNLTNEEVASEVAARERADTIINAAYVDAEIAKAEATGGPTPAQSAKIMRLMNRIGQPLGPE